MSKLIQSYVLERWFVSTTRRQSSAMTEPPAPHYYETFVWEWDKNTLKKGRLIEQHDSPDIPRRAIDKHAVTCTVLIEMAEDSPGNDAG